ncbi:hypothetical protein BU26DRAFT_518536 [Trematosphaeria pertusa]|uniref:Uncharacterized protein n=1 Tax=Trematosphaeria pertusa TaxID=390896 RepID=A0A6A6IIT0_9PLEO|nr:uncharacterized protein BU26DRAFT_518536 [Trematosphaeria pertusa]KAF2250087.1 hypothetical protein BU26DRAFT_518536 [Trematosphaeria pertusa]
MSISPSDRSSVDMSISPSDRSSVDMSISPSDRSSVEEIFRRATFANFFDYVGISSLYHFYEKDVVTYDLEEIDGMPVRIKFHLFNMETDIDGEEDEYDGDTQYEANAPADKYWIAPVVEDEVENHAGWYRRGMELPYRDVFALKSVASDRNSNTNTDLTFGTQLGYLEYRSESESYESEWLPTPFVVCLEFHPKTLQHQKLFFIDFTTVKRFGFLAKDYVDNPAVERIRSLSTLGHGVLTIARFDKADTGASFVAYRVMTHDGEKVWAHM